MAGLTIMLSQIFKSVSINGSHLSEFLKKDNCI